MAVCVAWLWTSPMKVTKGMSQIPLFGMSTPFRRSIDCSLSSETIHNMHNSFLQGIYRRVSISQLSLIANECFSSGTDVVFLAVLKFCSGFVLDRLCRVSVRGLFII